MKLTQEYIDSRLSPITNGPVSDRKFVKPMPLEEYAALYSHIAILTRDEKGILECRFHTDGDKVKWDDTYHKGCGHLMRYIGNDPENKCVIISGSGDWFLGMLDPTYVEFSQKMEEKESRVSDHAVWVYDIFHDAIGDVRNLLRDIHVPTIGVLNGPSIGLTCFGTFCDLCICTDDTYFYEPHYHTSMVPGDGHFLEFQYFLPYHVANAMAYLSKSISAEEALRYGLVNEVVPRDKIYDRAHEMANEIIDKAPQHVRHLTHELMTYKLQQFVEEQLHMHMLSESYGQVLSSAIDDRRSQESWETLQDQYAEMNKKEK